MIECRTLKILGVLALSSIAFAGLASAGERSTGRLGPGISVSPYVSNNIAIMKGYQIRPTVRQMNRVRIPTGRLHVKCPDGYFWKGYRCAPLFDGGWIGR